MRSLLFLPVAAVENGATAGALIVAAANAVPHKGRPLFERFFRAFRPRPQKVAAAAAITTGTIAQSSVIVIAEADPYYDKWQEDANERLKQERALGMRKEHPLAAEHPGSYVTVCEAGCRGAPDQIVSMVVKTASIDVPARPYVPADASAEAAAGAASVQPVQQQDQNTIECVAGCYDRPKKVRARDVASIEHPAAAPLPARAAPAIRVVARDPAPQFPAVQSRGVQTAPNGAIAGPSAMPENIVLPHDIARTIKARLGITNKWRTVIKRSNAGRTPAVPHIANAAFRSRNRHPAHFAAPHPIAWRWKAHPAARVAVHGGH